MCSTACSQWTCTQWTGSDRGQRSTKLRRPVLGTCINTLCCSPVFLYPPKIPTLPGLWDEGTSINHPITSFSTDLPIFSPKHPCWEDPRPPLTIVSVGTTGIILSITLKSNLWYNNFAEFTWWMFHFSISTVNPMPWVPVPPFLYKIAHFLGRPIFIWQVFRWTQ